MNHLNPENDKPDSNDMPAWLSKLHPSSVSSTAPGLQASVFYNAGYEAARRELSRAAWQRATVVATAASLLVVTASLFLILAMIRPNGLGEPGLNISEGNRTFALDKSQESNFKMAYAAGPASMSGNEQSGLPSWLQSTFNRASMLGYGIELGRIGADWDKIIVMKSPGNFEDASDSQSHVNSKPTELRSLRSMRNDQINSVLKSML